jgi:hypothetical protein
MLLRWDTAGDTCATTRAAAWRRSVDRMRIPMIADSDSDDRGQCLPSPISSGIGHVILTVLAAAHTRANCRVVGPLTSRIRRTLSRNLCLSRSISRQRAHPLFRSPQLLLRGLKSGAGGGAVSTLVNCCPRWAGICRSEALAATGRTAPPFWAGGHGAGWRGRFPAAGGLQNSTRLTGRRSWPAARAGNRPAAAVQAVRNRSPALAHGSVSRRCAAVAQCAPSISMPT